MKFAALGFAGQITSGKTTVSDRVARRLGVVRVSFSGYLRSVAADRDIKVMTREVLQDLGEQEIKTHGYKAFTRAVLDRAGWRPGQSVVIDSVRHVEVVAALKEITAPIDFHLVYLKIDPVTQRERLPRSLPAQKPIEDLERHSTEVQVQTDLPRIADLTLDATKDPEELADEVVRWTRRLDIEDRFRHLAAEWRAGIGPLSSTTKITQHPAYREVIALGREAVPLILCELEQEPGHWFAALRAITGEDPTTPADHGRVDRMAAAWVRWGKANGVKW